MKTLLWLRRDLRIHDNPALAEAMKVGVKDAVYISTPHQWSEHHVSPWQVDLLERHLFAMKQWLAELGIHLEHVRSERFSDQIEILKRYDCKHIFANSEPELNEIRRDKALIESGINLHLFHADTVVPKGALLNKQGSMFQVFTPFKAKWLDYVRQFGVECYATPKPSVESHANHQNDEKSEAQSRQAFNFHYPKSDSSKWPLSDEVMTNVIPHFLNEKINDYSDCRDIPSVKGTSGLSPYLAIGAISSRWLATQLIQQYPNVIFDMTHPAFSWLNELIWRDFYKHQLHHFPELSKGVDYHKKYQRLQWFNDKDSFQAWCNGTTGYPIVDAAMRQLKTTGWMHNRLRMIVASFLTKHLLIDWRWGEQFFMSHLIDGDLSANNGGWQWASGTGCDAQPYFRIFNPITQSKKFDPNGDFIRRYIPELKNVPDKDIHFPHDYLVQHPSTASYWPPIVEHKFARLRALDFYK
ncbi:deoxyribodipyrimidine photo-lyase [Vibrio sp. T187]|uniref:cryptochrome/photolyase family protein n=1 Tax=Vibrio TaxID=662 RepID=UPI0010C9BC56|nr:MULTISPECIES: FAD-binding domain-containing protein [Vibrio]MBW3696895.1 deoxyribodipyrimidine photo-lyase [Vibrio sp. T187]